MAETFESKIKAWLTPGLISCFGIVSWNLINEIRTDVKSLLESNAQVQVKIENLEKRLDGVENVIYSQRLAAILPKETEVPKRK
jgi:regulator of replication initiation timing